MRHLPLLGALLLATTVALSTGGPSSARVTAVAAPIDIEIAVDTTGSMQPSIDQAQADARGLVAGMRGRYPGARFAVVQFKDSFDDPEYRVEQPLTADPNLVQSAIDGLSAYGGDDNPEAYNLVFDSSLDPSLGWRTGARRLLVVIGDAEPHGALNAGFSGCQDTSVDPHGFNTRDELAKLKKQRVTLLMVFQNSSLASTSLDCYQSLAAASYSGGTALDGGGDVTGAIAQLIDDAILSYVAIGDSYSSGEGNPPFTAGSCHRSSAAWPNVLVSKVRRLTFLGNLACSGATKDALDHSFKGQPPMIDQVTPLDPDLVTLTITGNDVGFASILRDCVIGKCVTDGRLRRADQAVRAQLTYLPAYLTKLKQAAPNGKVVLVGYPQIFPRTQGEAVNCGWLEPNERQALNALGGDLNAIELKAAQRVGVQFVSVSDVLAGHELCTKDSWVFRLALSCDSKCGHPLPPGQNAIAVRVQKALGY